MMGWLEMLLYGVLGGMLAELLGLFKLRHEARGSLPMWLSSVFYWVITACMILAGGLLSLIYGQAGIELNPLLAVNIGASAPLILGSLVAQTPAAVAVD